jgi:hypothetical protein
MSDRKRHLRWMEFLWERHNSISREEERKEEVLKKFEGLSELSGRRIEIPYFPLWEPLW